MKKTILIFSVIVIIVLLFLSGPLFVYSPVIAGFDKKETKRAAIYFHKGCDISMAVNIDKLMEELEDFYAMEYGGKIELVITGSDAECRRLSMKNTRFNTYYNGRIMASGRTVKEAAEGKIHPDNYLKHELSHALLFRNMNVINSMKFPRWLNEGLATYAGGLRGVDGYNTGKEALNKIRQGYYLPFEKRDKAKMKDLRSKMPAGTAWFTYSGWATAVEALIETYGKEKFFEYLHAVMSGGKKEMAFKAAFGKNIQDIVNILQQYSGSNE